MDWFVQLHKKIMQWEWYTDVPTCKLFFHILLSANYKKAKWRWKEILPWQFITSLWHLATETGLSIQEVRTALVKLISTNEVTHQSTQQYTMLTLNNWEAYNTQDNKRSTNDQQTINKPSTTTNINNTEYKEYIETDTSVSQFEVSDSDFSPTDENLIPEIIKVPLAVIEKSDYEISIDFLKEISPHIFEPDIETPDYAVWHEKEWRAFLAHFIEKDKKGKMKAEREKTFSIKLRFLKWVSNWYGNKQNSNITY